MTDINLGSMRPTVKFPISANSNISIAVFVFAYLIIIILFLGHVYFLNDEVAMVHEIQSGWEVTFMSVILGKILSFFYLSVNPDLPWYGVFLYIIHSISLFLFIKALFRTGQNIYLILGSLLFYLLLYAHLLTGVSYTDAGIMLASNALILFLTYLNSSPKIWPILLLGICLALAFLIRIGSFIAAIVCFLPFLIFMAKRISAHKRTVLVFLVPLCITIIANSVVLKYGVSDEYKKYQEFNRLRYRFHDYPVSRLNMHNERLFKINGWTGQDYDLLTKFIFHDENKFNIRSMENIFKYSLPGPGIMDLLRDYPKQLSGLFIQYRNQFIILIFFLIASFYYLGVFFSPLLYLFYIISGMIYMSIFLRFPFHIGRPIFLSVFGFLIVFVCFLGKGDRAKTRLKTLYSLLILISLLATLSYSLVRLQGYSKAVKRYMPYVDACLNKINKEYPDAVILMGSYDEILFNYTDALKTYRSSPKFIVTTWKTFSPAFYDVINKELGINYAYEMLSKMVDNPRAYLLASEWYLSQVFSYFNEIYQLNCYPEKVGSFTEETSVYRLVSAKNRP